MCDLIVLVPDHCLFIRRDVAFEFVIFYPLPEIIDTQFMLQLLAALAQRQRQSIYFACPSGGSIYGVRQTTWLSLLLTLALMISNSFCVLLSTSYNSILMS